MDRQRDARRVGERIAKFTTPITIRVLVPPEASGLLYLPGRWP